MTDDTLFARWRAVADALGRWPDDITFGGDSINCEAKARWACDHLSPFEAERLDRAIARYEQAIERRRAYEESWAARERAQAEPDPLEPVTRDLLDAARRDAEYDATVPAKLDRIATLLEQLVERQPAGGPR